jgi:FKBP-type peptidyl-prolyl cis-trans isomerase (trigger factor)
MMATYVLDYIHDLKLAGVSDQQSEVHARRLAQAIEESNKRLEKNLHQELDIEALATKKDIELAIEKLRTEMHQIRYETFRFIVWTGASVVIALSGMLAKGFHWF